MADDFDADATLVLVNTTAGDKDADVLRSHLMGQGI
jgi:threonine synthase